MTEPPAVDDRPSKMTDAEQQKEVNDTAVKILALLGEASGAIGVAALVEAVVTLHIICQPKERFGVAMENFIDVLSTRRALVLEAIERAAVRDAQ